MADDGSAPRSAKEPRQKRVDTDFLPAALEILESPPSPIGRTIIWIVISAAVVALGWAMFAQVDMVAISEGRVIPRSRLQSVEAPEAGVIRAIHIVEGQRVEKDQPLLELDPTFAGADAAAARIEFETADLARARSEALLRHAAGQPARFTPPPNVSSSAAAAEASAVRARIAGLDARLAGIDQRIAGARAAILGAEAQLGKLEETQPLLVEQDGILRRLNAEGAATRPQMLDMERRLIENRRDIEVRKAEIIQTTAEITMLERERAQALAEFRAQAAAEQAEAEAIVATRAEGVRKARTREGYQTLLAPVSGIVNAISVTTVGEVAEAGAPLVTIVPEGEELIIEALVLNRDIGFVRPGQEVVVKLDAYPFTRHGHLEGVLEHVSPDATADESRGLVFPARVKIVESRLREVAAPMPVTRPGASPVPVGQQSPHPAERLAMTSVSGSETADAAKAQTLLFPGMSARVEIVTGRRTVMDYLLSPISRALREAGRER